MPKLTKNAKKIMLHIYMKFDVLFNYLIDLFIHAFLQRTQKSNNTTMSMDINLIWQFISNQ